MKICAGDLRDRIRFESFSAVVDSSGNPVQDPLTGEITKEWTLVTTCWSSKIPLSGRELLLAQQLQSAVMVRFVIRYRPDIDSSMRIVHNNIPYDIEAIIEDPDTGLEWQTLQCKRGVNAG